MRSDWERLGRIVTDAAGRAPQGTLHLGVAGRTVRLDVTGERLLGALDEPLGHLRTAPAEAGLTIAVVHGAEVGLTCASATALDPDQPHAYLLSRDRRLLVHRQHETLAVLDRGAGRIRAFVGDADRRSLYERGRPLETPLVVWLRDVGVAVVHGAAVAVGDAGALVVGRSGSGKSTLTATCLLDGMSVVNDDKVAVVPDGQGHRAHALNASLHLDATALDVVAALRRVAETPRHTGDDKHRVPVRLLHPDRVASHAAVTAIVAPRLVDDPVTTLERLRPPDAMRAIAVSTVTALPSSPASLDTFAALAETVPAWSLRIGRDGKGPSAIRGLLDAAAR